MTDIASAFGLPFSNSCSLSFDVAPILLPVRDDPSQSSSTKWIGVVTIHSVIGDITEYQYEVFSTETQKPMGDGIFFTKMRPIEQERKSITRGMVTKSNNMMFTFPITSVAIDYFVLVKPLYTTRNIRINAYPQFDHSDNVHPELFRDKGIGGDAQFENVASYDIRPNPHVAHVAHKPLVEPMQATQEFGIFYTSRLVKQRNALLRQMKKSKTHQTCATNAAPSNDVDAQTYESHFPANFKFELPTFASNFDFGDAMSESAKTSFWDEVKNRKSFEGEPNFQIKRLFEPIYLDETPPISQTLDETL